MSIASEITRLQGAKSTIKTKLNGINNSSNQITTETIDEYGDYIDTISTNINAAATKLETDLTNASLFSNNLIKKETGEDLKLELCKEEELDNFKLLGKTEQATAILPSEYTQVDYIQSSGTQCIDTGIKPSNTFGIDMKLQFTEIASSTDYFNTFGCGDDTNMIFIRQNDYNYTRAKYGSEGKSLSTILQDTNIHTIKWRQTNLRIDSTDYSFTTSTFSINYKLYLFTFNYKNDLGMARASKAKLYYCKIYDGNTLVRNFVPCYRNSDSVIGLYDTVNEVFYTNAGTGTFTKGNNSVLPNPDYSIEIQNVEGINKFDKSVASTYTTGTTISELDTGIRATLTASFLPLMKYGAIPIPNSDNLLGKTVRLSAKITPSATNSPRLSLACMLANGEPTATLDTQGSITETGSTLINLPSTYPSNATKFCLLFYSNVSSSTSSGTYIDYENVVLSVGDKNYDYVPYNSIQIKKCNKNKLGLGIQLNGYVDASTLKMVSSSSTSSSLNSVGYYINTRYLPDIITFKCDGGNRANVCYFNDIPANEVTCLLRSASNDNPRTITVNKNYQFMHIQFSYNNTNVSNIMINEGSTALNYIQPQTKTYNFPLSEGQKLYEDSTLEADGIHNKKKQVVLTGSEGWVENNYVFQTTGIVFPSDVALRTENTKAYSNMYKYAYYPSALTSNIQNYEFSWNGSKVLTIRDDNYSSASDFASHLAQLYSAGTPVIIEYELATSSETAFTSAQQSVDDEIINDGTYSDITYYTASGNLTPKMEINHYIDLQPKMNDTIDAVEAILNVN